jgi:hypothetical protein
VSCTPSPSDYFRSLKLNNSLSLRIYSVCESQVLMENKKLFSPVAERRLQKKLSRRASSFTILRIAMPLSSSQSIGPSFPDISYRSVDYFASTACIFLGMDMRGEYSCSLCPRSCEDDTALIPHTSASGYQCAFSLLRNGELMLEDFTSSYHTYIHWCDDCEDGDMVCRLKEEPRRRVIPQAPLRKSPSGLEKRLSLTSFDCNRLLQSQ